MARFFGRNDMQALIFNSGLGSRLGHLTENRPKSMVELGSGETIFHRQLRVLTSVGIRTFVVTTGPFPQMLEETAREFEKAGCTFHFVNNPVYDQTNYLYSMWLARDLLRGKETLLLHGDLVFDAAYVEGLLALPAGSYGSVDPALPLPEKVFKARVADGEVREVGVNTWGDDCLTFQAMYRLAPEAMDIWLDEVDAFVQRGETSVYAENAANEVFTRMHVVTHPYTGHVLEEIDTPEDLARVSAMIRAKDFADQPVFELGEGETTLFEGSAAGRVLTTPRLGHVLEDCGLVRPLVVADGFLTHETPIAPSEEARAGQLRADARQVLHECVVERYRRIDADNHHNRACGDHDEEKHRQDAHDAPYPFGAAYDGCRWCTCLRHV
jgi:choline kinase